MADLSKIEWTDATWNPTSGCVKVSPGCEHCYAERFAERFRGVPKNYWERGFDLTLRPGMLDRPFTWRVSKRIFVNSMSDLFHADVPDEYLDRVFDVMEGADWHVYQVLTKRPERMRRYLRRRYRGQLPGQIWLGVSVENNDFAWRAEMLREVDAAVRFLSVEPMLGPVDHVDFAGLHWIIVGGESGPRHRMADPEWIRDVRDRCVESQIAFFFKQWHKGGTGRLLDGRTWDEMPETYRSVPETCSA